MPGSSNSSDTVMPGRSLFVAMDCYSASYGNVLVPHGLDPAVLGDQWGYRYLVGDEPPHRRLAIARYPYDVTLRRWYGFSERDRSFPNAAAALDAAASALADGADVVVWVDTFEAPWTGYFRSIHHPHRVVVRAVDNRSVAVSDGQRGWEFEGDAARTDMQHAIAGAGLASILDDKRDCRNTFAELRRDRSLPPQRPSLRAAAMENVSRYFDATDELTGAAAATAFADDFAAWAASMESLDTPTYVELTTFFGELAGQRELNARFLIAVDHEERFPGSREMATAMDGLASAYATISRGIAMRAAPGRNARVALDRACARVRAVLAAEYELMQRVRYALR